MQPAETAEISGSRAKRRTPMVGLWVGNDHQKFIDLAFG